MQRSDAAAKPVRVGRCEAIHREPGTVLGWSHPYVNIRPNRDPATE
jgi:hypothetical protein